MTPNGVFLLIAMKAKCKDVIQGPYTRTKCNEESPVNRKTLKHRNVLPLFAPTFRLSFTSYELMYAEAHRRKTFDVLDP